MRRCISLAVLRSLLTLTVVVAGLAFAQGAPVRVVVLPFDVVGAPEALSIGFPTVVQRALNEVDGLYAPPLSDASTTLQRVLALSETPIADIVRVFNADLLVFARLQAPQPGTDSLTLELMAITAAGDELGRTLPGRLSALPALMLSAAETVLGFAGLPLVPSERAALSAVVNDAPPLPALAVASESAARFPGSRLADLSAAAEQVPNSAWLQAEWARALALNGRLDEALERAAEAVRLLPSVESQVTLGVVLSSRREREEARAAFEAALARNPAHALALTGLAQSGAAPEAAIGYLERAVAASPRLAEAHLSLAGLQNSPTRIVQVLRTAATFLPDSVNIQVALMGAALDAGDPRGALSLLQRAVADPIGRRPAIYALAERVAFALPQEALALVREGRALFPDDANLRGLEVALLRESGSTAEALANMEAWIASGSAPIDEVVGYAETLAIRGDLSAARAVLETLPEDNQSDLRSAQIELAGGRASRAVELLEEGVEAGTADAWRLAVYGAALGRLGRLEEATAFLQRAAAGDGASASVVDGAAALRAADYARRVLAVLGQQDRVLGDARIALNAEAGAAFEQGLYALEAGDTAAARDAFVRAREAQSEGFLAFFEGYTRQLLGDSRGAILAYSAARPTLGGNPVLLNNLGFAYLQVGRYDLALETLQEAVSLDAGNARAHFNLGLTYYGLGRFALAVAAFDAALAIEPSLERSAAAAIEEARRRAAP